MAEESNPLPISIGMHVEVDLVSQSGETERLAFTLVPDEQADFTAGFLGAGTPLAKALLGRTAGSELSYAVGDIRAVKILTVAISDRSPARDVAARREAVIREAVDHSDYINAMIFASAVNTKWGDYDADGLDPAKWSKKPEEPDDQDKKE
jgi:hypothetical protein